MNDFEMSLILRLGRSKNKENCKASYVINRMLNKSQLIQKIF